MLRKDLDTEYSVRKHLKSAIAPVRVTPRLCEPRPVAGVQLRDTEEDHAYWLEKQIGLTVTRWPAELPAIADRFVVRRSPGH